MKAKKKAPGGSRRHDLLDIDWQAVARGEIKLTKEQEAAAADAAAEHRAKREAYLAANSGKKVKHDFYNGSADLILCHAKWYCKTKAEKLEYFRWVLKIFYSSPEYVFRTENEAAKIKKDREEYLLDPIKFKRKYTKTIAPADGTRYEMTYREELDPWTEIENEIKRLQAEKSETPKDERQEKERKQPDMPFNILKPFDKNLTDTVNCSNFRRSAGIHTNTFQRWYNNGRKTCAGFKTEDWKDQNDVVSGTGRIRLKHIPKSRFVIKGNLMEFLKFTEPGFMEYLQTLLNLK